MAKKPTRAKLRISSPSQSVLATAANNEDIQYKLRDDADRIKRYAELKKDATRHQAAMDHIKSEHDVVMGLDSQADYNADEGRKARRGVARAGRRTAPRNIGGRR